MNLILFQVCLGILMVVPLVFVYHRIYDDGIIGRGALLGISFASITFLMEMAVGSEYAILPQTLLLVLSFTVFLLWHLWRFHKRVLSKHGRRENERRCGADRRFISVPERRRQETEPS